MIICAHCTATVIIPRSLHSLVLAIMKFFQPQTNYSNDETLLYAVNDKKNCPKKKSKFNKSYKYMTLTFYISMLGHVLTYTDYIV